MKMIDIKKKSVNELVKLGGELRESLREFRFGGAGSRVRDVKQGRTSRRDIARIETEIRMRALAPDTKDGIPSRG